MKIFKAALASLVIVGACYGQISGAGSFGCNGQSFTGTTWSTSTTVSTTQALATAIVGPSVTIVLDTSAGSFSAGAITIQEDPGDGNFVAVDAFRVTDPTAVPFSAIALPYTLVTNTAKQFMIITTGIANLQLTISTAITGTGTLTPHWFTNCALQKQFNQSNVSQWVGTTLGAPSNYGTSPGAVIVPGVNAFVTNTPAVTQSGNWTARVVGNVGGIMDAVTGATAPANALQVGAQFVTSPTTLTTGQMGALNLDSAQNLLVNLKTAVPAGTNLIGSVKISDGTTVAGVIVGTTALKTDISSVAGTATSTAASGVQKVGVVGNAGAAVDAATGAAPPANAILFGGLGSGATGGFVTALPVCDSFFNINIATATTTLAVTGVSGRHVRICHIDMVATLADNVALISGTGATCGTGSAAIVGTTSGTGYPFAANGGISSGSGLGTIMRTVATGDSVCIITSAATQLSGVISYTIY